jgi:hypothetical protein
MNSGKRFVTRLLIGRKGNGYLGPVLCGWVTSLNVRHRVDEEACETYALHRIVLSGGLGRSIILVKGSITIAFWMGSKPARDL